jgi:hypothetical protein
MDNKTSTKQQVQMFSISNRNSEVLEILNNVDNKSEFICQAIIEKAKNKNNSSSITNDELENKIKDVVLKLLLDNNLNISIQKENILETKNEMVSNNQNKVVDEKVNTTIAETDEEERDILKSVAMDW